MRATFSDTGAFTGSVDGFKAALAGLIMDVSGVQITPATATVPASFQAALVKVLKADNQDVPTLDPTDPTLVFSFTNLKYKDGQFEIGGAEVPINAWEFGTAFKMTNQSLGLTNSNGVQALQIKSTLTFFGDDADPVSYTHLDVYKRQGQPRAGPASSTSRIRPTSRSRATLSQ